MVDEGIYKVTYETYLFSDEESPTNCLGPYFSQTDFVAVWEEGGTTMAQGVIPSEDMSEEYYSLERARELGIPCGYLHFASSSRPFPIEEIKTVLELITLPLNFSNLRIKKEADLSAFLSGCWQDF